MSLLSVDLPQPFFPKMATCSPCLIERLMSLSASTFSSGYLKQSWFASILPFSTTLLLICLLLPDSLRPVDLCCTHFAQQYIGSHIIENASDTILA